MRIPTLIIATIVSLALSSTAAAAKDWIFDDGYYTVDPKTGKRVDQFQKKAVAQGLTYDEYFSANGPGAWIPFGYYEENLGIGFMFGGYGGYGYGGGYGGYGGYGFGAGYPAFGGFGMY